MKNLLCLFLFFNIIMTLNAQNSLLFDGSDDFVHLSTYPGVSGTNARTVEAWIKIDSTVGTDHCIITYGTNSASQKWSLRVQGTSGSTAGNLRIECNGGYKTGTTYLCDNQWHHVAAVWSNDGTPNIIDTDLYVDGVLEATDAQLSWAVNTTPGTGVQLGKRLNSTFYFNGSMDEVKMWSTARTQSQILESMNSGVCDNVGLELYYQFDQGVINGTNGTVDTLIDASGNNRHADLTNFALTGTGSNWALGTSLTTLSSTQLQITNQTNIDCYGDSTGVISVAATGGSTSYSYVWSNGDSTATISNISAGTYTVNVTGINSCPTDTTIIITEEDQLVVSIDNITDETCVGDSTGSIATSTTGGVSPYNYLWDDSASQTTATASTLTSGTYTITVIDSNGCMLVESASVISTNPLPIVSLGADTTAALDSLELIATSGFLTYDWSTGDSGSSNSIYVTNSGTYTVTVTDANGCMASDDIVVDLVVGINALHNSMTDFVIFPNPAHNLVTLRFTDTHNTDFQINITDISGSSVYLGEGNMAGNSEQTIQLNDIVSGFYFLSIVKDGRLVASKQLVIQ